MTISNMWHFYVRGGKAYVPVVAQTDAGFFLDIDPVAVVPVDASRPHDDRRPIGTVSVSMIISQRRPFCAGRRRLYYCCCLRARRSSAAAFAASLAAASSFASSTLFLSLSARSKISVGPLMNSSLLTLPSPSVSNCPPCISPPPFCLRRSARRFGTSLLSR